MNLNDFLLVTLEFFSANFTVSPKNVRQGALMKNFQFKCSCEACTNDYPLMQNLFKYDSNFSIKTGADENLSSARSAFEKNCELVTKLVQQLPFPCFETCSIMQQNFELLKYIAAQA